MIWEFENYVIHSETDLLNFEDLEGNHLGVVMYYGNKEEMIQELNNGVNPIEDKWEDGIGNTISLKGW